MDSVSVVSELRGRLNAFTLVDGVFDPIHDGHVDYFNCAAELGNPVACLVAPDSYARSKHDTLLLPIERARVLDSIRHIEIVVLSSSDTASNIELLQPKVFFKGGDWTNRLPIDIVETCRKVNCAIEFGPPPVNSSTKIIKRIQRNH